MKKKSVKMKTFFVIVKLTILNCFIIAAIATPDVLSQVGNVYQEEGCGFPLSDSETTDENSRAACYVANSCDLPETRIGYLYDTTESITWLRIKFHVIAEDDGSNPASTQTIVQSQMDQVNADFAPYGIQFIWDMRFVNASWARVWPSMGFFDQEPLRLEFFEDNDYQLNIIATELINPGYSGSSNPQIFPPYSDSGGIVMSTNPSWNQFTAILSRHTLSHEIGHIFGLLHPYSGYSEWVNPGTNCFSPCAENLGTGSTEENGDYCSDTPPQPAWGGSTFSGAGNDLCSGQPWPAIPNTNFMNAANTSKDDFSPLQIARFRCYMENFMNLWIAGVRIKSDTRYGQVPLTVQFTGEEHDSVSSWLWNFGDDSTSTVQNPLHTYTEPGVYTISLTGTSDTTYNAVNNAFVAVHADTISIPRTESLQNDTVTVALTASNYLPVSLFQIPVNYSNSLNIELIEVSTAGLRTSGGTATLIHHDTTTKQFTIEISAASGFFESDTGSIANLRFLVPVGELDSALLDIANYDSYQPDIETYYGNHSPMAVSGGYLIRSSCCIGRSGDLNGDGLDGNILDLNFAVNYIFRNTVGLGDCDLENDVNQDGFNLNIIDLNFLVNRVFRGGPAPPNCP